MQLMQFALNRKPFNDNDSVIIRRHWNPAMPAEK